MGRGNQTSFSLKSWIAAVCALVLSGCGDEEIAKLTTASTATPTPTPTPTPGPKHIFVTAASHNGRFGINAAMAMVAADLFCKVDANNTNGGDYKAMLVGSERDTTNDWVLAANTEYYRLSDDAIIGTTNASGTFDFPLSNYLNDGFGTRVWTGLNGDWSNSSHNCYNWTDGSYSYYGSYGYTGYTDSSTINYGSYYCAYSYKVVCVEE
jgi:hypothetical protein